MVADPELVWKALADPTRRRILEKLTEEPETTGRIVEEFSPKLVRTAVMKHLGVLEGAGLIRVERVGRTRWNHIEKGPLRTISTWLGDRGTKHQNRMLRLKQVAEERRTRDSREESSPAYNGE